MLKLSYVIFFFKCEIAEMKNFRWDMLLHTEVTFLLKQNERGCSIMALRETPDLKVGGSTPFGLTIFFVFSNFLCFFPKNVDFF